MPTIKDKRGSRSILRSTLLLRAFVACVILQAGVPFLITGGQRGNKRPLMKMLPRFSSSKVPAMSPEETEAPPLAPAPPAPIDLPGNGMARHPMLYIGEGYNKILLAIDGKIQWTYSTGPGWEYDDVWMLSNGNILFTRMQYIAEITPEKKVVWRYDAPAGTEIHACQPIGKDKVLFIVNGLPPRLIVMNKKTRATEVNHVLPAVSLTDTKTVHAQFRRVRYTKDGTYLIPFLQMNRVVEYDRKFQEVWSYTIPTPWAAIRLKNGNTLITDERDVVTREVTRQGSTSWELTKADIPARFWYGNAQSATRLANGNTVVCSRGGDHHGPQLVEVTPDKKVVWVLQDWQHFGPATAVQFLDEPGIPERPGDSLH
jgi:hypothetical protein